MHFIYLVFNYVDGRTYVGQSKDPKRPASHIFGKSSNKHLRFAVSKHGTASFVSEVLEDNLSQEQADEREKYWIAYFKEIGVLLYNIKPGGRGSHIYVASEATKRKQSLALRGRKLSPEARAKMSAAQKARCPSTRAKTCPGKRGKPTWNKGKKLGPQDEEIRRRKSEKMKGKKNAGSWGTRPPHNKVSQEVIGQLRESTLSNRELAEIFGLHHRTIRRLRA